jgi:hypothetical protein
MTRSSVAAFTALWRAYGEGRLERSFDLIDPACRLVMADGRTYDGHDGLREWLAEVRGWRTLTVTYDRIEETHPGLVVATGRVAGAPGHGGARVDGPLACVGEFRHGLLTAVHVFADAPAAERYAAERAGGEP